jgi:hypothetical protein
MSVRLRLNSQPHSQRTKIPLRRLHFSGSRPNKLHQLFGRPRMVTNPSSENDRWPQIRSTFCLTYSSRVEENEMRDIEIRSGTHRSGYHEHDMRHQSPVLTGVSLSQHTADFETFSENSRDEACTSHTLCRASFFLWCRGCEFFHIFTVSNLLFLPFTAVAYSCISGVSRVGLIRDYGV